MRLDWIGQEKGFQRDIVVLARNTPHEIDKEAPYDLLSSTTSLRTPPTSPETTPLFARSI
jgi:hypothetical protein